MPDISLPWIITGAVVLIILNYIYKHWKSWLYQNRLHRAQQAKMRECLFAAVDHRSIFSIQFQNSKLQKLKISGVLLNFDMRSIKIDTSLKHNLEAVTGEKIKIYFSLPRKEAPLFYEFPSEVLGSSIKQGLATLEVKTPTHLNENQKRAFLRFSPRNGLISFLGMWLDLPKKEITPIIENLPKVARLKKNVDNISAGGLRLLLNLHDPLTKRLAINQGITMLLLLKSFKEDKPDQALWLTGYVVATNKSIKNLEQVYISIKFTSWAYYQPNPEQDLSWLEVGTEGIAPIASFVVLRHLEQHNLNAGAN